MLQKSPINLQRIEEMTEGDADFKSELVTALHASLLELREKYLEGAELVDEEIIQEIRHKVKPSLSLFEIEELSRVVNEGREILHESGFGSEFLRHLDEFIDVVQDAIDCIKSEIND